MDHARRRKRKRNIVGPSRGKRGTPPDLIRETEHTKSSARKRRPGARNYGILVSNVRRVCEHSCYRILARERKNTPRLLNGFDCPYGQSVLQYQLCSRERSGHLRVQYTARVDVIDKILPAEYILTYRDVIHPSFLNVIMRYCTAYLPTVSPRRFPEKYFYHLHWLGIGPSPWWGEDAGGGGELVLPYCWSRGRG